MKMLVSKRLLLVLRITLLVIFALWSGIGTSQISYATPPNPGVFLICWQNKTPDLSRPIECEVTLKFEGAENPIQARIDRMVAQLKTESLEQSLAALPACEFYRWPGSIDPSLVFYKFPFERKVGSNSVKEILSNRRFRKILQELRQLSREEQAVVLLAALRHSLETYEQIYKRFHEQNSPYFGSELPFPTTSPSIPISDNRDGSPTIYGSRLSVLALMLVAGNLNLVECNAAVRGIVEKAIAQKNEMESTEKFHMMYRYSMIRDASLYNRQVLATALIGTSPVGGPGTKPCDMGSSQWKTAQLTKFDALATAYDLHYKHGAIKIDKETKTVSVKYLTPLIDEEFNTIVDHLKKVK